MKSFLVLTVVVAVFVAKCTAARVKTVAVRQESGENENLRFAYDGHTHMLMLLRQAVCYIFVLTDAEKSLVHTDSGLRNLEMKILSQLGQPNVSLTTVPKNVLHANIIRECGKGVLHYHIVQ